MKPLALLRVAGVVSFVCACSSPPTRHPGSPTGTGGAGTGGAGTGGGISHPMGGSGPAGMIAAGGFGGFGGFGGDVDAGFQQPPPETPDADIDPDAGVEPPPVACPPWTRDGGVDGPPGCRISTVPSQSCTVAKTAIVPAVLCAGEATCPVTAAARLACDNGGTARMSLAPRADGASILLDVGEAGFDSQLFTVATGGPGHVEYFSNLINGRIAVDKAGVRNFFVGSDRGGRRFRETSTGWVREDLDTNPVLNFPFHVDARVVDDGHAVAAIGGGDGLSLGVRDEGGWKFMPVTGVNLGDVGFTMDVAADGRPWLATLGTHDDVFDTAYIDVVSPDGKYETLSASTAVGDTSTPPFVLAGGVDGNATRPAVAYRLDDGIHLATPSTPTGWSQRLVPGTALVAQDTAACPADGQVLLNCGIKTCDAHATGSGMGLALARTASGTSYLAWLDIDEIRTYKLDRDPTCGIGAQGCICRTGDFVSRHGSSSLALARVTADAGAGPAVRRFTFPDTTDGLGTIAIAARGDTLLVAAMVSADSAPAEVRYLEIDATKLP